MSRDAATKCSATSSLEAAKPSVTSSNASSSRASTSNSSFNPSTLNISVLSCRFYGYHVIKTYTFFGLLLLVQLAETNSPPSAWAHVTQEHFQKGTSKAKAKRQRKVKDKQPLGRQELSPEDCVGEDSDDGNREAVDFNDNLSEEDEDVALPPVMKIKAAKADAITSKIPRGMLVKVYVAIKSF